MAEVFAGFLSYTDAQIGRVLDYLEESGQLDNTIIVVISDNGASGEGGPNGSVNEVKFFNGYIDTVEEGLRCSTTSAVRETYNHYPIGWAMAFNTPYKLFKRYASHEGGIADTAIISWPQRARRARRGARQLRQRLRRHPDGVRPARITPPATVRRGWRRSRCDGVSFKAALDDPHAPTRKGDPVLHDAGHPRHLAPGLVRQHRARRHRPRVGRTSTTTVGSCSTSTTDRSQCHDLAAETARTNSQNSWRCGPPRRRDTTACPLSRPEHLRDDLTLAAVSGG